MLIETFKSMEEFKQHVESQYVQQFKHNLPNLIIANGANVEIYKPVA